MAEDTAARPARPSSAIFTGQFADADTGSSFSGIAVVGNTADAGTQGTWQYSTNGGTTGSRSARWPMAPRPWRSAVRRLIRFLPMPNYNGAPPALVVRGLDNTYVGGFSTTAGSESPLNVNTTTNGGTTAIAAATANLSTTITAVNDAPIRTAGSVANLTVLEDSGFTSLGFGGGGLQPRWRGRRERPSAHLSDHGPA